MREREPLKCLHGPGDMGEGCGEPIWITRQTSGLATVQSNGWWIPSSEVWIGQCDCRRVQRKTEGDLYRALGYIYA